MGAHSAQQRKLGPLSEADRSIEPPSVSHLLQHCPLWGMGFQYRERRKAILKGKGASSGSPSGILLQQLGIRPLLSLSGRTAPHLALRCRLQSHPLQGQSCPHTLSGDAACVHIKSNSPAKGVGHICIGTLPRKNTPSGPQQGTFT